MFGYTWMDNLQPGGPTYHWIDIVSPDRMVTGLSDDNNRGPFPLTTNVNDKFIFYWYPVEQFWIGSNGYISFDNINLASIFPTIPDSVDNKNNFIAALLSDLNFSGAGNPASCYYKVTVDSVIISFIDVPFYSQTLPNWAGSNSFQIILDKLDRSITLNYQAQTGTAMTTTDVRAGMENLTGAIGLQPFASTYPSPGYTIKFYYPNNSTYLIRDGAVKYNSIPYSRGEFLSLPSSYVLISNIANMGNLNIAPLYHATCTVKDVGGVIAASDMNFFTDTLFTQQDTTIYFNNAFIPTVPGTYSFTTRLWDVLNDGVSTNDSVIQELVVIDTSMNQYDLRFCDNTPDPSGISWVGGDGGVGMYFIPPTYPVKITSSNFYIESNLSNVGSYIKIFDDDGPDGSPGTLLDSTYVAPPIASGAWSTVTYTNPVIINEGGFYLGWEMGGTNITIGVDRTIPISHRSFEIISGVWSEYRDSRTQDFMLYCTVQKHQVEDVGLVSIVNPQANDTISAATTVSCWIRNFGALPETGFPVHYMMTGQAMVTQNYTGIAIQPGDSVLFTFSGSFTPTANLNAPFCVWTDLNYDADVSNDSLCIFVTTSVAIGIDEQGSQGLQVFPNPFAEYTEIRFQNPDQQDVLLQMTDLTGRILLCKTLVNDGTIRLEKGDLPPGMYILRIQKQDQSWVQKLLIE